MSESPLSNGPESEWNGRDWYVNFGERNRSRNWDDGRRYGFVAAGGGRWYSDSLQELPVGGRVFAYIPKSGYVGIGIVTGTAAPADHATLTVGERTVPFRSLELNAPYAHEKVDADPHEDYREWIVPVQWTHTVAREDAFRIPGLFANQNSACRLRHRFTIETVTSYFEDARGSCCSPGERPNMLPPC